MRPEGAKFDFCQGAGGTSLELSAYEQNAQDPANSLNTLGFSLILYLIPSYGILVMAIQSFSDSETEKVYNGERSKKWNAISKIAKRKLHMLDAAFNLNDLRSPPGNRLHPLIGDRLGQHSIAINDQYRICFVWTDQGPKDVEITDYH